MVVTLRCDQCGKDFRQARHWQKFCSNKCRNDWHRHNYKLEEVKEAEADHAAKQQLVALRTRIDGTALVNALKAGIEPAPAEPMRRRAL